MVTSKLIGFIQVLNIIKYHWIIMQYELNRLINTLIIPTKLILG